MSNLDDYSQASPYSNVQLLCICTAQNTLNAQCPSCAHTCLTGNEPRHFLLHMLVNSLPKHICEQADIGTAVMLASFDFNDVTRWCGQ